MFTSPISSDPFYSSYSQSFLPGRFVLDHVNSTIVKGEAREPLTTAARLDGYDMVWAVTQDSLNAQFEYLQLSNILPSSLRLGNLQADGLAIGGDGNDCATLAPPFIDFDTGLPRLARLTLVLTGGTVSFYQGYGPSAPVVKQSLVGWKLAFLVQLSLTETEPGLPGAALTKALRTRLDAVDTSQFSIGRIVLDFGASDLSRHDLSGSNLPSSNSFLKQAFVTALAGWVRAQAGATNPFVLGYPLTRKWPSEAPDAAFEPTGANLSTCRSGKPTELDAIGSLNFLLLTGKRKMSDSPALYAPEAGNFARPLVRTPGIDARGLIAREVFLQRYVKPLLVDPLQAAIGALPDYLHARMDRWRDMNRRELINTKTGVAADLANGLRAGFVPTPSGWILSDHVKLSWHESGAHSHDRSSEQLLQYTVDLSTQADAAGVARLTLDIAGVLMRHECDQVNQDFPFKHDVYMGKGWARVTLGWRIRVQFVPGADGRLVLTCSCSQDAPLQESGSGGVYVLAELYANLFNQHTIVDDWEHNSAGMAALAASVVGQLVAGSDTVFERAMLPVLLAARPEMACQDIQLNQDGDIEIDFTCCAQDD
ncbi:MAG: hypothetical protein V4508_05115 [Pseudomonadota bacterium]